MSNSSIRSRQRPAAMPSAQQETSLGRTERAKRLQARAEADPLAEPTELSELDNPLSTDASETDSAPPLRGKVHPRRELSDAVPTLDDEIRNYHHHPNDTAVIEFEVNPDAADAAADLASDLGSEFLEGATRGQDLSDIVMSHDDSEGDLPYLVEGDEDIDGPTSEGQDEGGASIRDDESRQPARERSRRRVPR